MKRVVVLIVALVFLGGLIALIGYDASVDGVTPLNVLGVLMLVLIGVPVLGALLSRHPEHVQEKLEQQRQRMWDEGKRI